LLIDIQTDAILMLWTWPQEKRKRVHVTKRHVSREAIQEHRGIERAKKENREVSLFAEIGPAPPDAKSSEWRSLQSF